MNPYYPAKPYLGQLHISEGSLWRWNGLNWGVVSLTLANSPATPYSAPEMTLEALEARITAIEEALNSSFLLID